MVTGSRRTQNGRERRAPAVVDAPPARSWLLPVVVMAAAFLMRLTPWSTVFFGDHVSLRGNDAGYHLRVIDHLIANFPHLLTFDPYAGPGGDRRLGLRPHPHRPAVLETLEQSYGVLYTREVEGTMDFAKLHKLINRTGHRPRAGDAPS